LRLKSIERWTGKFAGRITRIRRRWWWRTDYGLDGHDRLGRGKLDRRRQGLGRFCDRSLSDWLRRAPARAGSGRFGPPRFTHLHPHPYQPAQQQQRPHPIQAAETASPTGAAKFVSTAACHDGIKPVSGSRPKTELTRPPAGKRPDTSGCPARKCEPCLSR
jgi:hypothetical protein